MILGFDTSGPRVSIAVCDGARVVAAVHEDMAKGQAEALLPMAQVLLEQAGVGMADLTRIAVGIGPGNFTGVRISVSAAKGLARGLGIEACGVSLLEAAAFGAEGPVLACLSAPKEQAFVQGFGVEGYETPVLAAISELGRLDGVMCVGSASEAVAVQVNGRAAAPLMETAVAIATIAQERLAPATPQYLREADAAPSRLKAPELLS